MEEEAERKERGKDVGRDRKQEREERGRGMNTYP